MKNIDRIECEKELLGMLLNYGIAQYLKEDVIDEIRTFLKPHCFQDRKHQLIFEEILKIRDSELDPIIGLVSDRLVDENLFVYLSELVKNSTSSTVNFLEYAYQIYQAYRNRTGLKLFSSLIKDFEDVDSFMLNIDKAYQAIDNKYQEISYISKEKAIEKSVDEYTKMSQGTNNYFSTGYRSIDQLISGFHKGGLYVLGARPSMGKTALAMNFIHHLIENTKIDTLFFSLEMNARQIADRYISLATRIPLINLKQWDENDNFNDKILLSKVREILENQTRMDIDGKMERVSVDYIRLRARQHKAKYPNLGFIVIDYLQLLESEQRGNPSSNSRVLELGAMTRKLKGLSMELDIPVLLLSQLNRGLQNRQDKRPVNSDLRDSGAIEQDADVIFLLHREDAYKEEKDNKAEIIVGKNRNGTTGTAILAWDGTRCKFNDLDSLMI